MWVLVYEIRGEFLCEMWFPNARIAYLATKAAEETHSGLHFIDTAF